MKRSKRTRQAGILALLLAVFTLAGCGGLDGTKTALTVNGTDLSMGAANFWLRYQQASTYTMMAGYGLGTDSLWGTEVSATSEDDSEMITYGESTKDNVKTDLVSYMLLREHAKDYDVAISEDLQKSIDEAAAKTMTANEEAFKKMGVSEGNVKEILELVSYRPLLYDLVTADVDTEVSDEEAKQSTISLVRISKLKYDDQGVAVAPTSEEILEWTMKLNTVIAAAKESGNPAEADLEALAGEASEDASYMSFSFGADDKLIEDEVKAAVATLKDGEIYDQVIATGDYLTVVRLDKDFDEEKTATRKDSIVSQRKSEAFTAKIDEWREAAEITETEDWKALQITDAEVYQASYTQE